MELNNIYRGLILELEDFASPAPDAPPPEPEGLPPEAPSTPDVPVIHLPDVNVIVSLIPRENKIIFAPQDHQSFTEKMKDYVTLMQQNFRIDNIKDLGQGMFEMSFDPRESYESVIQFLRQVSQGEI